ncbi:MAG: hypothetical protein IPH77_14610 [Ignavibacteria bacterium]|nr:hypothetical protein [Ignavibacteria bacterium]
MSGPDTGPRTAFAVVKSSYRISSGSNQPRLYYKVNNGTIKLSESSYSNLDTFKFTIPGQIINTLSVKYYIAVRFFRIFGLYFTLRWFLGKITPGTVPPANMFQYQVCKYLYCMIGTRFYFSNFPFATYYMDAKTRNMYLSSEINTAEFKYYADSI